MQQINLYTDAFRPKKVILSLEQIILISLCTLIILVVVTLFLNAKLADSESLIALEKEKVKKLESQLVVMEGKATLLREDDSLVATNKRLSDQLKARRQLVDVLDSIVVKDDEGFSKILSSLARHKTDGLWLTGIQVGASGQTMTLEGVTLNANAVPIYLQNLREEDGFLGRTFTLFNLDADPDRPKRLNFSLRSQVTNTQQVNTTQGSMP